MSIYVLLFILVVFSLALLGYHWKRRKIYRLSKILPGPPCLPLIGNGLLFNCKDEEIFGRLSKVFGQYPSPMRMWIGPKFFIVFKEAEQIQKIISSMIFLDKDDDVYRFMKVYDGEGMIPGSGPKWKQDRKLIAPLFSTKNISMHFPLCLRESNILVTKLKTHVGKGAFDIEELLQRCSADIVAEILSGFKFDAQNNKADFFLENFKRAYVIIHARMIKFWLQNDFLFRFSPYYKEQEHTKKIVHAHLKDLLDKSKETFDSGGANQNCTIHQMLKIKEDIPNFVTDMEIVHHLSTLFSASQDTIALVSSFTLVMLGMYPKIQKKVANEIRTILGNTKNNFEVGDLQKFVYLEMCIKEVLRLFPIGPYIVRVASEDVVIDGKKIPKGCAVMIAIYNIHRDPKYWERPNEFYPEHFSSCGESHRHPYAFIPFSAGLRGCIGGRALAMMSIKTLLVRILQHYQIEADGKLEDKELKVDISLRFIDNNYPIRIRERTQ